jgi:Icc-related predicted phosphoesterase
MSSVTIVCISDTHELHRELDIPAGDLLLHAGDFTMFSRSLRAIEDFNDWLGEHSHSRTIVVPGNHDSFLEADPRRRNLLTNATVLIDEAVEVMGLKIWGSPITPLYGGALGRSSAKDRIALYKTIPPDTDILMTHGPLYGILDCPPGTDTHTGCRELLEAVLQLKPRVHLFGHVHGAYGTVDKGGTLFVNAALLREDGSPGNAPIRLRMPRSLKLRRSSRKR